jgi:predicted amidohydrolase
VLSLIPHLEKSITTLELATRLGKVCLQQDEEIQDQLRIPAAARHLESLEACVDEMDRSLWLSPGPTGDFIHLLDDDGFKKTLERVETFPPLECLGVLRGMLGAVREVYDNTQSTVELRLGMPLPIPKRGINRLFKPTPNSDTSSLLELLWKSGFSLFSPRPGTRASVRLDFRAARRLDELTWGAEKRLPRIATIHPSLGPGGIEIAEEDEATNSFFGVRPQDWDRDGILKQLRNAKGKAEIALLPELSLPQADALEASVSAEPKAFPPLIVAGSAHQKDGEGDSEVRSNEARIYLDGECIGRHRKIHPFVMNRRLDGRELTTPMVEGLTRERKAITILSGDYTRLAVMICSDLISRKLPGQLEDAEVNLLLVPALTPEPGSFNGKICKLASDYQAVSVVANADSALFAGRRPPPFLVMAAVPRPRSGEQSREYRPRWRSCPTTGIVDPNRRLRWAVKWQ